MPWLIPTRQWLTYTDSGRSRKPAQRQLRAESGSSADRYRVIIRVGLVIQSWRHAHRRGASGQQPLAWSHAPDPEQG